MSKMFKKMIATLAIAALGVMGLGATAMAVDLPNLQGVSIEGAGASFPFPIYSLWAEEYNRLTGLQINYQSIGSGGGIAQIKAGTVLFGASDAPLTAEELNESGLIQFPMVIGGVVPVINVPGVNPGEMKITANILSKIFLGEITNWNHPAIRSLNPDLTLPDMEITVVHRSDGSGTTWIFSNYLAKVSPAWRDEIGFGKSLDWPVGVGGQKNAGVAAYVAQINGSIGYVEYAYALQNQLTYVLLKNRNGHFVAPTAENFQAAAANADWANAPGYYMVLTDQPGDNSWPITGASFILVHKEMENRRQAEALFKYLDWAFRDGGGFALDLDYVPIPQNVYQMVENTWRNDIRVDGRPIWE